MKIRSLIIALTLSLLLPLYVSADAGDTATASDDESTMILYQTNKSGRPNAPSRVTIECIYGEGYLTIVFPESVAYISVKVYNETEEYVGIVTVEDATMALPILIGEYNIECTTDDGRLFSGVIVW